MTSPQLAHHSYERAPHTLDLTHDPWQRPWGTWVPWALVALGLAVGALFL